jgi:heat shock protein HslJ
MKNLILLSLAMFLGLTSCKSRSVIVDDKATTVVCESKPNTILNDIWALQSMKGSDYNPKEAKKGVQIPTLEFHIKEMRYGGNDGCNSIFGAIDKLNSTELKFGTGGSTRKFCADDEISPVFIQNIKLVAEYKIEKTSLYLLDAEGKTLMTFRKVD